jgi:deoxyribose-phosphate aldolase
VFAGATQLARIIDHTLVRPDATLDDLAAACESAKKYGFACVAVNSSYVAQAQSFLSNTLTKVCAVVGFPHGSSTTTVKIFEAMECIKNGASELDIVANIGMIKSGRYDFVEIDIKNIISLTPQKVHKIIIETGSLTTDEIIRVSQIAARAGAEFIKTSTGYGTRGATADDVRLIRQTVGTSCRIKASGGIKDLATLTAMVEAGADRIGTSAGPKIMEEYMKKDR